MTTTMRLDQALFLAVELRRLDRLGSHPEADQAARTIDELVGRFAGGRLVWPQLVADAAGRPSRGDGRRR